ncbi:FAD-binding oxidoreductase [Phytoactinopolyspora halotolerans]|uniref:FAD-binding oxidoreductase n=1 Tax=Phytoactinopolyspora halotolerans TaxID=1981512 RepID=A0A6L9S9S7_9ACTN|nr:FAD-binding oxidoreductase [Phytoactinopolyspora halotolerans]NEE01827.1 FAD-binding oxidoreductase [Phytoactinopolyspora halotolerans]
MDSTVSRTPATSASDTSFLPHGQVITPDDAGYDDARAVWNGMIDRRPAVIARCTDADDVAAALAHARAHRLPVSVRGGGHNVSGTAVRDGSLVVDLSPMRTVDVDPDRRRVRADGGALLGEVDRATQEHGLAVPFGVYSETGLAGLTLGGGLGWLRRAYGASCDNLVAADLVTASGERVRASETENPGLLWGLRGGGGGLGVVTSFEFRAYPVGPDVTLALVFHPWTDAAAAMRNYHEWSQNAPDDVSSFAIVWHAPAIDDIPAQYHHQPVVTYAAVHSGDPAQAQADLAPLRDFGSPIADLTDVMPYVDAQKLFDEDYPAHVMRYYWTSLYLTGMDDEVIDALRELNEACPSPHSTLDVWQLGGAFSRVGADETALGDRSAPYLLGVEANWEDDADDEANIAWARKVRDTMERFSTGAEYLNFPGFYEAGERTLRRMFGSNYERLAALRRAYDPDGLFSSEGHIPA